MEKFFSFLKSSVHFFKIVVLFCVIMLLLLWIQTLTNDNWAWTNFIKPLLKNFLDIASLVSNESIDLFGAVFEYKFGITLLIFVAIYYICNLVTKVLEKVEDLFDSGKRIINKMEQNALNQYLHSQTASEEKKIRGYYIYVKTSLKKKFSHAGLNVNIDEQNCIMNKFLIDKTGETPKEYEGGFLYQYSDFNKIDTILKSFFKLINSDTMLDYTICVQIINNEPLEKLKQLIGLNFVNKISMLSETSYRYKFNNSHMYGTSQLGLYQKNNDTIEVMEFIEL